MFNFSKQPLRETVVAIAGAIFIWFCFTQERPMLLSLGPGWNDDEMRDAFVNFFGRIITFLVLFCGISPSRRLALIYFLLACVLVGMVFFNQFCQPEPPAKETYQGDKEW